MKVNLASAAALVATIVILDRETRSSPWDSLRIAGAVIGLLGITLIVIARMQLGGALPGKTGPRKLVTTGLYARVRNPIYLSSMLVIAGIAMYVHKPWMVLGVVVVLPAQLVWIQAEERTLRERFGEAYDLYRARTWF